MGVKPWPVGRDQPFGIKSDYTWSEIGTLFRIIDEQNVTLFIETGVGLGDLSAWMIARAGFDPGFSYLGITNDPGMVDLSIRNRLNEQVFIAAGSPCSVSTVGRITRLVKNSSCALILCNGLDIGKEVDHYLSVLRSGDVLVAHQFPAVYSGRQIISGDREGKVKRIVGDWVTRSRFIAGVIQ